MKAVPALPLRPLRTLFEPSRQRMAIEKSAQLVGPLLEQRRLGK